MCGIMGYIGPKKVLDVVVKGLECLEYRGYDSAGVAVANGNGIKIVKCVGSVANLKTKLTGEHLEGTMGIGHTRWATHGGVTDINAHPHMDPSGKVVLIHNGIIENFHELKDELTAAGIKFTSETDTEVAACLIMSLYHGDPKAAICAACEKMRGAYAFVIMFADVQDRYYCVKKGPPLVLGTSEGEAFCASDAMALLPYTHSVIFMEDNEIAELSRNGISIFDFSGRAKDVKLQTVDWDSSMTSKGMYPHYMLKEIDEQPSVIRRTLAGRFEQGISLAKEFPFDDQCVQDISRIHLIACGTSYYASTIAGCLMDKFTGLDVRVETASEYRYGNVICDRHTLAVFISQSGETADTLAAARLTKSKGALCLAVTNVVGSSLAREVGLVLPLHAGPEIGVAATKTFIGQLASLTLLALWIGKRRSLLSSADEDRLVHELTVIPMKLEKVIEQKELIRDVATQYKDAKNFLFMGRGLSYAVGMEGALKLKEISYIHAEAYAAGEMKHGPIALLDSSLPVVAIVPKDGLYEKTLSNMQEARARKAPIIALATEGDENIKNFADSFIYVPATENELTPFLTVVPLQLFAYHMAYLWGREIDRPRNLAKSVTVE